MRSTKSHETTPTGFRVNSRPFVDPLWLFRLLLRRKILFVDILDYLQLRTKLLVTAKTDFIAALYRPAAVRSGEQNLRMSRQQIFVFVDCYPVVIDERAGCGDRKVTGYLGSNLLKTQYAISFAINPDTPARANGNNGRRSIRTIAGTQV